jgi:hypothetical protein
MDIKKTFGTNRKAEADGVWVDLGDGARIKVARETSVRYRERLRDVLRPHRGAMNVGAINDEQSHKLLAKAAAGTMLLDWEGITSDGKPVPFTVEAAEQLMVDLPDFYNAVANFAKEAALYREVYEADEQKNSQPGSSGS